MTEFEKLDVDNSGAIDRSEWDALALEDRRKQIDDDDAHRDQTRKMAWYGLLGMLLYPVLVIGCDFMSLKAAGTTIGGMAGVYFVAIAGVVGVFMAAPNLAKKSTETKGK
jgi:hypothetical protein